MQSPVPDTLIGTNDAGWGVGFAPAERQVSLPIGTRGSCKMTTTVSLHKSHDGSRRCRPGLQLDLDPVRGLGLALGLRFGLGMGFAFTDGRVLRARFPRSVVGDDAVHSLVGAGLQGVQAVRSAGVLVLRREYRCVRRRTFTGIANPHGHRGGGFRHQTGGIEACL